MKEIIHASFEYLCDGQFVSDGRFALLRTEWRKYYKTGVPKIDGLIRRGEAFPSNFRGNIRAKLAEGGAYVEPTRIAWYSEGISCVCCLANGEALWINLAYMPMVHRYVCKLIDETRVSLTLGGEIVGNIALVLRDRELVRYENLLP